MSIDELVSQLLGDDPHALTPTLRQWLSTSRRFRSFAERYQTKIRAKLRGPGDAETLQDLLFELACARWLLQEKRFQLAYEEQGLRTAPAPDFTVHFTTKVLFHVEVTRIRPSAAAEDQAPVVPDAYTNKLFYVIFNKLSQLQAGAANLLLIGLDPIVIAGNNVDDLLKQMRQRIESGDPALLTRGRLQTPAEFFKQYYALSAMLFYFIPPTPTVSASLAPLLWLNQVAKYPLLTQVQTILRQLPPND